MKKILVPVDFSGHTGITCTYALEYARIYGAEIRLFHTYFDQIIISDTSFPDSINMTNLYNEGLLREIINQAQKSMDDLKAKLDAKIHDEHLANVSLTTTVTGGEMENELRDLCQEYHPDLVIMGTKGKGKNLNVWGKVATYIINHAKVPVLTVPEMETFKGFEHIMFSADLSEWNADSLKKVMQTFEAIPFHIFCVHFLLKGKHEEEPDKMKILGEKFRKEKESGRLSFDMIEVTEDNQKAIDYFVASKSISIIAFQPYRHSMFYSFFTKNITKRNLFATNVPLLAIPVQEI
jgi:nucleotide-binding universal stress UspA family protein